MRKAILAFIAIAGLMALFLACGVGGYVGYRALSGILTRAELFNRLKDVGLRIATLEELMGAIQTEADFQARKPKLLAELDALTRDLEAIRGLQLAPGSVLQACEPVLDATLDTLIAYIREVRQAIDAEDFDALRRLTQNPPDVEAVFNQWQACLERTP